ncbi:MAG: hypothetical protein OXC42_00180 [Gammaproteobacteria bacterium]|nr:hypothetical protein [Gammaproteobacteria bacterium]
MITVLLTASISGCAWFTMPDPAQHSTEATTYTPDPIPASVLARHYCPPQDFYCVWELHQWEREQRARSRHEATRHPFSRYDRIRERTR